jgi:hypothetical protein
MISAKSLSNYEYTDSPEFFSTLFEYAEGLLEIRLLPGGERMFIELSDASRRAQYCKQHISTNIFFGVGTRDGHAGAKENIVSIPCLYCDVDFKLTPPETFKKNFAGFDVPVTACVESGFGLHLYWKLKEPLTKADIPTLEAVNKRIAAQLGGDPGSTDAARVLRVPGTFNHKYNPPSPVKLVVLSKNECELTDFDFLPVLPQQARQTPAGNGDKWIAEALRGVPAGMRHPKGIRLAGFFLSRGVPVDVIESILRLWNEKNSPPLSEARLTEIAKNIRRYEEPFGDPNDDNKIRITFGHG